MAGAIAVSPKFYFPSSAGVPLVGGTLETYLAGTTTPVATYADQGLSSSNGTSITLDARGECVLWLDETKTYKFVLKNSLGVEQYTVDNISGVLNLASLGFGAATLSGFVNSQTCADYAALRAYTGTAKAAYVTGYLASANPDGIAGEFTRDDSDTTSADNAATIIVANNGVRWKRAFTGGYDVRWFGAKGDGSNDDTNAIQAAINYVGSIGGGDVIFKEGDYQITSQLNVNDNNVRLVGSGQGGSATGLASTQNSAATRIYWGSAASASSAIIEFRTLVDALLKYGGGVERIMLDCMNLAGVGLRIATWSSGHFSDLCVYAATSIAVHLTTTSYTLALGGTQNVQRCLFENINTFANNYATNNMTALQLDEDAASVDAANACFNRFIGCRFAKGPGGAGWGVYLLNSDNNMFFGCNTPEFVFCSTDESANGAARYNMVVACEADVIAKASQTGGNSSNNNLVLGLNQSNTAGDVTIETGAGGSSDAGLVVIRSDGTMYLPPGAPPSGTVVSNRMDVFERGDWVPAVEGSTSAGTGTYTNRDGRYTRIGDVVYFKGYVEYTAHTGTGNIRIAGLPYFAGADSMQDTVNVRSANLTFTGQLLGFIGSGDQYITLQTITSGATGSSVAMDTAATIYVSGLYWAGAS